jgi:methionyl-tRNA formyltransferase
MLHRPTILFASENLQLGGMALIALARMAAVAEVAVAGVWTNSEAMPSPGLDASAHRALLAATTARAVDGGDTGAVFGGVYVPDYATLAAELGLEHACVDVRARHVAAAVAGLGVDLGVVCGYGKRVPGAVLSAARQGWVNLHPSLLPQHRGPFPGFWEMRAGEAETGVTAHVMEEEFDSGPVVEVERIELPQAVGFGELVAMQAEAGARLMGAMVAYARGEVRTAAQEGDGSHEGMPGPMDVVLDGGMSVEGVERFVAGMRGVTPVLVAVGNEAYAVDGLVRSIRASGAEMGGLVPGRAALKSRDVVRMEVRDGVVEMLVTPFVLAGAE